MNDAQSPPGDPRALEAWIVSAFEGVEVAYNGDDAFLFVGEERTLPFATIVTSDAYDTVSDLDRAGVYRLNLGVAKASFQRLFGDADAVHDMTELDALLPHPTYGKLWWVCVLNPGERTFEAVRELTREAHGLAAARYAKRAGR